MTPWGEYVSAGDLRAYGQRATGLSTPQVGGAWGLVVVDMTDAFISSTYSTGIGPAAVHAVARTTHLLDTARRCGAPVWFTVGYHSALPSSELSRWKSGGAESAPPPSRAANRIINSLEPRDDELVIDKMGRASAFFGTPLITYVIDRGLCGLVVTGLTTSGCVRATVVDAFQYNLRVAVPHDAVADRSPLSHASSLLDMHMRYCDVVDSSVAERLFDVDSRDRRHQSVGTGVLG